MNAKGWIYDAYPEGDQITLWMKTDDSRILKLTDSVEAEIYAVPNKHTPIQFAEIVSEHPLAKSASVYWKYQQITDDSKSEVVRISTTQTKLRKLTWDLEAAGLCTLYNTDLSPVQRYFFSKAIQGFGRFVVQYDEKYRINTITSKSSEVTPPLNAIQFQPEPCEKASQEELVQSNSQIILVQRELRPLLYAWLRRTGILTYYTPRALPGKIIVDSEAFQNLGIAGLDEKSRFASLPIGTVASWGPSRTIDSRQCHEALAKDILIPRTKTGTAKNVLTAKEVAYTDRGALILSPKVGLHENVAELDFESLFPQIIVKHNISYETVSSDGIDCSRKGFLVDITERFLQRRLTFKHRKKDLAENAAEWIECDQRELLLKKLLVCLYGYSGSDLNRFGNVFAYREVNRIGRETVVAAMNIALREGFQLIYLDTDSIFVKRPGASFHDFQRLSDQIRKETDFSISVANHYRYLVLLTQEADPEIEAARRFYGKLTDGRVYYRGIELRRHDYPPFLKHFQRRLLDIILDAETASEMTSSQLPLATRLTQEMLDEVQSGNLPVSELTISKILRMPVERYRSLFPHVTAAVQLRQKQKPVRPGDFVDYVYVDAEQINPMKRVAPAEFADTYDTNKYSEMLLDVAESILGVFGFTRTQLGFQNRPRNFLEELRNERTKEILMELEGLEQDAQSIR